MLSDGGHYLVLLGSADFHCRRAWHWSHEPVVAIAMPPASHILADDDPFTGQACNRCTNLAGRPQFFEPPNTGRTRGDRLDDLAFDFTQGGSAQGVRCGREPIGHARFYASDRGYDAAIRVPKGGQVVSCEELKQFQVRGIIKRSRLQNLQDRFKRFGCWLLANLKYDSGDPARSQRYEHAMADAEGTAHGWRHLVAQAINSSRRSNDDHLGLHQNHSRDAIYTAAALRHETQPARWQRSSGHASTPPGSGSIVTAG